MINSFKDQYRFLSNFFVLRNPIAYKGLYYLSVEHFYQAMKATGQLPGSYGCRSRPGNSEKVGGCVPRLQTSARGWESLARKCNFSPTDSWINELKKEVKL